MAIIRIGADLVVQTKEGVPLEEGTIVEMTPGTYMIDVTLDVPSSLLVPAGTRVTSNVVTMEISVAAGRQYELALTSKVDSGLYMKQGIPMLIQTLDPSMVDEWLGARRSGRVLHVHNCGVYTPCFSPAE